MLRQDDAHRRSARTQPHRPAGRAFYAQVLLGHRPAARGLAGNPRGSAGGRGHLAAGPATTGRQQALRRPQLQDPALLQGLAACAGCGYAYYRGHTTTTAGNKIYYYRCLGADDYRYEHGRVCDNKPVRTDYLDKLVWDQITGLLTNPALIHAEIDRRLNQLCTADPTTAQQQRLKQALTTASSSITRLIKAYQEQLISLDELRERMPELRSRETSLRSQLDALTAQLVNRDAYLKLATNLEDFPHPAAQQRRHCHRPRAATRTSPARQRRPHRA